MRIALIAPTAIPSRRANTIQVMKMAQALVLTGQEVHLAAPGTPSRGATWPELQHHYGLTVEFPLTWLPTHPQLRGYDYALHAIRFAHRLRADLFYTRHPQTAALSSQLGQPTLFEIHDLPQGAGKTLFRAFLTGRGARRLIAITQALANDLNTQYPIPNILTLPDGVDLSRYASLPDPVQARQMLHLPEQFTAGYTGHLYEGRGMDHLLNLAARLPDIHFLLAGGNPEDIANLKSRIGQPANQSPNNRQSPIANTQSPISNIHLTGFIPNADLPRYQAACDLLLMPYQRRVAASSGGDIAPYLSPMKLFEYMAAGRAILSSDLPVFREVLNPDNALLLPPDNVDAWVDAIRALQTDPEKRAAFGSRARADAKQYTWEARAVRMLEGLG